MSCRGLGLAQAARAVSSRCAVAQAVRRCVVSALGARAHIPSGTVVSAQAAGREVERRGARAQRTVIRKLSSKGL